MLTRGPKDSPDPCKAQGQPCTLRGTKGRVTGAQAQPWAWLCCESRPCRGGGGGVGAALAAESPGSPRRDLPDPTTHKRGDEGLGQKVPTAERCVPALRASPVGWHLSAPLGRGDAPRPVTLTQRLVLAPRVVGQRWLPAAGRGCEAESRGAGEEPRASRGAGGAPRGRRAGQRCRGPGRGWLSSPGSGLFLPGPCVRPGSRCIHFLRLPYTAPFRRGPQCPGSRHAGGHSGADRRRGAPRAASWPGPRRGGGRRRRGLAARRKRAPDAGEGAGGAAEARSGEVGPRGSHFPGRARVTMWEEGSVPGRGRRALPPPREEWATRPSPKAPVRRDGCGELAHQGRTQTECTPAVGASRSGPGPGKRTGPPPVHPVPSDHAAGGRWGRGRPGLCWPQSPGGSWSQGEPNTHLARGSCPSLPG